MSVHGSPTNPAGIVHWCSWGGSGSREPALLSRHPLGDVTETSDQNLHIPAGTGLPSANHPLPKHHRAVASVDDHLRRWIMLSSQ